MSQLRNSLLISMLILVIFSACEKDEQPIQPHNAGDNISNSISLGSDYRKQAYFDLASNTMVAENIKNIWDLGFESESSGTHIILNASKLMSVAATGSTVFTNVSDTAGYTFIYDAPSGNLDSTAIGDWNGTNEVFIIDRGTNHQGVHQGFKKVIFQTVNASFFVFRHANLNGSNEVIDTIYKMPDHNFSFASFDVPSSVVTVEPPKENWDLSFSQYTEIFTDTDPPTPYIVTGVLLNRNNVEACVIIDKAYDQISYADIAAYPFFKDITTIGFDWKVYDFDAAQYIVDPTRCYIVQSTEGKFFKLHFIDFYDTGGTKGTPTFEFQEL